MALAVILREAKNDSRDSSMKFDRTLQIPLVSVVPDSLMKVNTP